MLAIICSGSQHGLRNLIGISCIVVIQAVYFVSIDKFTQEST